MEIFELEHDIKIVCVEAASFPDGVMAAFQKLHSLLPDAKTRNYFGISAPKKPGEIYYKAAVQEAYEGEAKKLGCELFVIRKGMYTSSVIRDFMKDTSAIGRTFQHLLNNTRIEPHGVCVEMYLGEHDVRCMVKLSEGRV